MLTSGSCSSVVHLPSPAPTSRWVILMYLSTCVCIHITSLGHIIHRGQKKWLPFFLNRTRTQKKSRGKDRFYTPAHLHEYGVVRAKIKMRLLLKKNPKSYMLILDFQLSRINNHSLDNGLFAVLFQFCLMEAFEFSCLEVEKMPLKADFPEQSFDLPL